MAPYAGTCNCQSQVKMCLKSTLMFALWSLAYCYNRQIEKLGQVIQFRNLF